MKSCKSRICLTCDGGQLVLHALALWKTGNGPPQRRTRPDCAGTDVVIMPLLLISLKMIGNCILFLGYTKKKFFSITLDNASSKVRMVKKLKRDLRSSSPLPLDGKWNSTYDMIHRALEVKDAFDLFVTYERDIVNAIYENEWDTIQDICDFLEPFYHITKLFSGSKYPTANLYLSCKVCIEELLTEYHTDPSDAMRKMATPM
ncbi:putative AC transposase [Bienertia sinuspersici]